MIQNSSGPEEIADLNTSPNPETLPSFETLRELAHRDPEQLEQLRQRLSDKTINSAPEHMRPRLRGLQFRIDATRRLAKSPLDACIQLSEMMLQSLEELRAVFNGNGSPLASRAGADRPTAKILPFQR